METKEKELPSGYRLKKSGGCYEIVDTETGEVVSLHYHNINYPRAKIGGHRTTLKKENGLFVPIKIRPSISIELDNLPDERYNKNQKNIIEKCRAEGYNRERKKLRSMRPKSNKTSKGTSPLATKKESEYKKSEKEENNNKNKDNDDNEEDEQDIRLSKSNYILILASRIANVLEPGTEDWYIITSYDLINEEKLEKIEDLDDIRNIDHPFPITKEDLGDIKRQTRSLYQNSSNEHIIQNLKNDTYSL